MPKALDHVHTFERKKGKSKSGQMIFRCTDPDCWFYTSRDNLVGKRAKCPYCGTEFILTSEILRRSKKVHCINCTKSPQGEQSKQETNALEEILKKDFGIE